MTGSPRYPIPADSHRVEEEIQRSRFITTLAPAGSVEEAQAAIDAVRREFPDATHHCWAYVVGPPGSSDRVGMSDDGEPHGTAGRPMLKVLSHGGVGDVVAVVTRYYGGTKLGKGGLVRAYGGGVQQALASLAVVEKIAYRRVKLFLDYGHVAACRRLAEALQVCFLHETYAVDVAFELAVPVDAAEAFETRLRQLSNGRYLLEPLD